MRTLRYVLDRTYTSNLALEGLNFNEMEIMNTDLGSKANCITYSFDAGTRITPGAVHCTQECPF